jgi:hypothetical protein
VPGHTALGDERANRIPPDRHSLGVYTISERRMMGDELGAEGYEL